MALGSTLTSSASGSCRRRAIEIAPRNREIEIRKLLSREVRSGVDARARFAHRDGKHLSQALIVWVLILWTGILQEFANQRQCFARSSAVADRDRAAIVLCDEAAKRRLSCVCIALAGMRIDHVMRQELAGLIDHGNLAAASQAGVNPQDSNRPGWRRKQQVMQIFTEYLYRFQIGTAF